MPGFDGTGPLGQGSMTGRAMGICNGANQNVQGNATLSRGLGLGRGMRGGGRRFAGRGRGRVFYNNPVPTQNVIPNDQVNQQLVDEKNAMEEKVRVLEEKIKALEEKHEL